VPIKGTDVLLVEEDERGEALIGALKYVNTIRTTVSQEDRLRVRRTGITESREMELLKLTT